MSEHVDRQEQAARQAFLGFCVAYKHRNVEFDVDEYEYVDEATEMAWVAFWNGWRARGDLVSAADIVRGYPKDLLQWRGQKLKTPKKVAKKATKKKVSKKKKAKAKK